MMVLFCIMLVWYAGTFASETPEQRLQKERQDIRERFADVQQVSTAELEAWLVDEARIPPVLLDVRKEAEYAVSHLKDARRVEPGTSSAELLQSLDPHRAIVVYCSVGERSSDFARELQAKGFPSVFNLDGSIFQWANEGRPLFVGKQSTDRVHPYNHKWGRLLKEERHPPRKQEP